jgi:hypothetical protein
MSGPQTIIDPLLAHAKLYEELAHACSNRRLAAEFTWYAQQCYDATKSLQAVCDLVKPVDTAMHSGCRLH